MITTINRVTDLSRRRKDKNVLKYIPIGLTLEKLIQTQTSINLNTITNNNLETHFNDLLNLLL